MQDKQEKIKRKTQKVIDNNGSTPLAHLDVAMETNEKLEELVNPERVQKMEIMGAEIITIKGAKGDKGDTGEQGLQGEQGIQGIKGDKGEQGIQGLKGETGDKGENGIDGIDGKDGQNGTDGKDGSPDTAGEIATKLETLLGEDRLSASAIKGLEFVKTKDFQSAMSNIKGFMPYGNGSSSSSTASLAIGSAITGATEGSVLFAGTAGVLAQDNANLFYDDTLDILKLGGGTPTYTLANTQSMAMTKSIAGFYLPFAGQNTDNGTTSSTDITLSNNLGTDTTNYLDIGINSSTNTDPLYTGFAAGSGYMYNQSGDLVLATASAKDFKVLTGGTLLANIRMTINSVGLTTFASSITGVSSVVGHSITPTINQSGGGSYTALLVNPTETAVGSGSKLLASFQKGGVAQVTISNLGIINVMGVVGASTIQSSSNNPVIHLGTNIMTSGNGDLVLAGRQGYGVLIGSSATTGTSATPVVWVTKDGRVGIGKEAAFTEALEITQSAGTNSYTRTTSQGGTAGFYTRHSRNSAGTPQASQTNDTLGVFGAVGYGTSYATSLRGFFDIHASETWTGSAQGTYLSWYTTATGGTTTAEAMRLDGDKTLTIGGGMCVGYVAKTGAYTATNADSTINCTSGTFTVTLPTAVGIAGRIYNVVNSGAGVITIATTSSQTFTNVTGTPTTLTLTTLGTYTVQSDGANWLVL